MKRFGCSLVICFCLFISSSPGGQKETDTESLRAFDERIRQYEQIMDRYFRQNPAATARQKYNLAVDRYNTRVQASNDTNTNRKSEIDKQEKALEKLKKQINKYDAQLVDKSDSQLLSQRNHLVRQYNQQLEKHENAILQFNEWVTQTSQNLEAEKTKLENIKAALDSEIKHYQEWLRLDKDQEFWIDLNRTYLDLHRKKRVGENSSRLKEQIQEIRGLRRELGTYAIKQAQSRENGLVIISGIINRTEEVHFIVDTGANYVSLTPELIEVLGLKDGLGEVTDLKLAAGKTAWGQEIIYPYLSVLGKEELNVPGIAIPEKNVGIDGLLGRSFLKRFVVCFDFEQEPRIQLTPRKP